MNSHPRARIPGRILLACTLAAPLVSLSAFADESAENTTPVKLPEVVVTARRVPEAPVNVPACTQVITRDEIRESGATNLIDLLESQANLQFTSLSSSPTNTTVSLRGTGGAGTGGNGRTLILLDGLRTNRPDMGQFNWLQFDLNAIDSVEIIQGPQGAFYGDNAVGGVIKINTLGTPTKSGGNAQVLAGSDGTVKIAAGYTEKFDKAWTSVSGGYDTSDGYRDHSGYNSSHGDIGVGYDNQKDSVTRLNVSFLDNNFDQPGHLSKTQFDQDPTQAGTSLGDGWSDYTRVAVNNTYGASANAKLLTDAGFSSTKEYYHTDFGFPGSDNFYHRTINTLFLSPKVRIEKGDFTFTPGVDVNHDELELKVNGSSSVDATLEHTAVSPYLTAEWRASTQVVFSAAYRHEWNTINAREASSGQEADRVDGGDALQLAVNYKPSQTLRLYAKYDHAYRFPATDEIAYYQGSGGGPSFSTFFNPDLKPEVSDNFELGGTWQKQGWSAGAAAYYLRTRDEIFYNYGDNLNENLPETRRIGVQASGGYETKVAGFRSRVDYVDARLSEGTGNVVAGTLRMVPAVHLTNVVFVRPLEGLELRLTHRYIGSSYIDDSYQSASPGSVAGVNLFDGRISYRIGSKWTVFTGVNNIFDRSYVSYASSLPAYSVPAGYYPGQGRFVYAGSSVSF